MCLWFSHCMYKGFCSRTLGLRALPLYENISAMHIGPMLSEPELKRATSSGVKIMVYKIINAKVTTANSDKSINYRKSQIFRC